MKTTNYVEVRGANLEVEFIRVCPYCKKRTKVRKATCGDAICQYKHHIKHLRDYWDKHYRKTNRINKSREIF